MQKIKDFISGEEVNATPEEVNAVQPYSRILVEDLNYPKCMIMTHPQYRVKSSPSDKRGYPIDIAVFEEDESGNKRLKIVVETKKSTRRDGQDQLEDYLKFCEAKIGVWYNGKESIYIEKIEESGNIHFREIPAIPKYRQKLEEIGLYKRKDLKGTHNLKNIFNEIRGYIVGNSVGVNRDEIIAAGMINLILCKIYDERFTKMCDIVKFRASDADTDDEIKKRIDGLFLSVKTKYKDVLTKEDVIGFDGHTLRYIIGKIQNYCLIDTDRDTIADAFEVFIDESLKGGQGQFFTPKNVVQLIVEAVNPSIDDVIIDPSCGSCSFLVEALKKLWAQIDVQGQEYGWNESAIAEEKKTIGIKNIRGIEKDSFLTKLGKSYMAILGDGKSGIFCEDSLDVPSNWKEMTQQNVKLGTFSVSFSNPPFGKNIKVTGKQKLLQYQLATRTDADGREKMQDEGNVSTLFLERNMQLLKDGGKLGIILPETYFHAPNKKAVRDFIFQHNILWIIDLPHDTFRPHNNAKCIAIVIQKNTTQQPKINMAVAEYIGHDHNGKPLYEIDRESGTFTDRILDDTANIIDEIRHKNSGESYEAKYTFEVDAERIKKLGILIPRYYWNSKKEEIREKAKDGDMTLVPIRQLIEEKVITFFDGNGSPKSEFKGVGDIPYIRVKDIVNWQIYKDPTAFISETEYKRLYKASKQLREKDVLFVRRGSYRIGSVAMASPYDLKLILTREILVLRVIDKENKYGLTPEYLLYALSHNLTMEQEKNKIFIDTTLPNIADRWKEIEIPFYNDENKKKEIEEKVSSIIENQWNALRNMSEMKCDYDVYNT